MYIYVISNFSLLRGCCSKKYPPMGKNVYSGKYFCDVWSEISIYTLKKLKTTWANWHSPDWFFKARLILGNQVQPKASGFLGDRTHLFSIQDPWYRSPPSLLSCKDILNYPLCILWSCLHGVPLAQCHPISIPCTFPTIPCFLLADSV